MSFSPTSRAFHMFKLVVYATKCGDNKSTKVSSLDLDLNGDTLG